MGTTQTKLHYKVLKQSWSSTHAHLSTPAGQRNARQVNPLGDTPLHLCCYGGQAPPSIIRALILAYPASTTIRNKEGYLPVELARINYGRDQEGTGSLTIRGASASSALPSRSSGYRRDVLELLDDRENGFLDMAMRELLSKTAPAVPSSWMPLAMPPVILIPPTEAKAAVVTETRDRVI